MGGPGSGRKKGSMGKSTIKAGVGQKKLPGKTPSGGRIFKNKDGSYTVKYKNGQSKNTRVNINTLRNGAVGSNW